MDVRLTQLLKDLERFGTINKEDVPEFVKLVRELADSEKLAWYQLNALQEQMEEYR